MPSILLTGGEIGFLKQLEAAGDRGRTMSGPTPRSGLRRLIDAGYVTDRAVSIDVVFYKITNLGREALVAAKLLGDVG
jgi:hypothetical protein